MKKSILFLLGIAPFLLHAQTTETRTVDAFTGVSTGALVDIQLKPGSPCSVTLEGEAEATKSITTEVKDGVLVIGQDGHSKNGPVTVYVTISDLKKVDISGAASLKGTGTFVSDSVRVEGSGGSQLELSVSATAVSVDLSGASSLRLCGTGDRFHVSLSGASEMRAGCMDAQIVNITASGASDGSVMASQKVVAKSSGASDILIYGDATDRQVERSGASSVEAKSGSGMSDTTRIALGDRHIEISHNPDERSSREKKESDDDFEFWQGLDLGVNGLVTYDNQFTMPQGLEYMELNYVKSYVFGWNVFQKNIHIYRNNVNLATGIGFTWYHYNLRNSYSLQPDAEYVTPVFDSLDYSRNRLNMCYANIPLMLEFNTNNSNADRSFHFGGGVQFGYNIFKNKLKQKYELDGRTYKRKIKDDFNVNPFKIDLVGRIGFGEFTIFASYSLTTLFEENKGPKLYPFTAGVHLDF
jgi:hypothetical protein